MVAPGGVGSGWLSKLLHSNVELVMQQVTAIEARSH
jgi:hypothetical protein